MQRAVHVALEARATALDEAVQARIREVNTANSAVVDALQIQRDRCPPFDAPGFDDASAVEAIVEARRTLDQLVVEDGDSHELRSMRDAAYAVLDEATNVMDLWSARSTAERTAGWASLQARHDEWRAASAALVTATGEDPWRVWLGAR